MQRECELISGKIQTDGQSSFPVVGSDGSSHAFREVPGNGEAQTGGMAGGFYGEKTFKQALCHDRGEIRGSVGKVDLPLGMQTYRQISGAVFGGVHQYIAQNPL